MNNYLDDSKLNLNQSFCIVGLDGFGISCFEYLARKGCKVNAVYNLDEIKMQIHAPLLEELKALTLQITSNWPEALVNAQYFDESILNLSDCLVISPGISFWHPVIEQYKRNKLVIGELEFFRQFCNTPVIGITGTNGKSTVTSLLSAMLSRSQVNIATGGNMKTHLMNLLTEPAPEFYVLELSSFQLESESAIQYKAAAVLNLGIDHMDRYTHIAHYHKSKTSIYRHCEFAIVNKSLAADCREIDKHAEIIYYGLETPVAGQFGLIEEKQGLYLAYGQQKLIAVDQLPVRGKHQIENQLAALALGVALDLPFDDMIPVLQSWQALSYTCQLSAKINGVKWYNDSKAVNISACIAALEFVSTQIKGKIILLAGGFYRPTDFSQMASLVQTHVQHLIVFGSSAEYLAKTFEHLVPLTHVQNLSQAVKLAYDLAQLNDAVLLAPACASYDMFKNFKHRAEVFEQCVDRLRK